MVATAPSMLAGPPTQGRRASRIASDRRGATEVAPENAVFGPLAHRPDCTLAVSCLGRPRPHRRGTHRDRRRFSGQTRDGRYSWARYYHPDLQRFISEDPIRFGGRDINLYGYVRNNPLRFTDPLGLFNFIGGAGGSLVGGTGAEASGGLYLNLGGGSQSLDAGVYGSAGIGVG